MKMQQKNMHSLKEKQYRQIVVIIRKKPVLVVAERKGFFDPQKEFEIFKYGVQRFALVKTGSPNVVLQNCKDISKIKNGMATYWDLKGQWGLLNERAQIICEAGILAASKKPSKK